MYSSKSCSCSTCCTNTALDSLKTFLLSRLTTNKYPTKTSTTATSVLTKTVCRMFFAVIPVKNVCVFKSSNYSIFYKSIKEQYKMFKTGVSMWKRFLFFSTNPQGFPTQN